MSTISHNVNQPSAAMPTALEDAAMPGLSSAAALQLWDANRAHSQPMPGAYEWWRVEAVDGRGDGVVLLLFNGLPFHPEYLARVARSKRRIKNSRILPGDLQPSNYPAACMTMYKDHKSVAQFLNMYPPGSVSAAADGLEIQVGPNRLTMRADGSIGVEARGYPFKMRAGRAHHILSQELSATMTLTPTFAGVQHFRSFRPPAKDGAAHHWVVAAPHCRAKGNAQLINLKESESLVDLPISGNAYHDHMLGQGVLGQDLNRCVWGHALGEDFAIVWQRTVLANNANSPTDGLLLFAAGRSPVVIESPEIEVQRFRRTSPWLMRYPQRVLVHGSDAHGNLAELIVEHSIMDASPFHWRLRADAALTIPGRGRFVASGSATGVIMGRLKWPLLSDAVLDAIHLVHADDPLWRR